MNDPIRIERAAFALDSDWPVHIDYTAIAVSYVGAQMYGADRVLPRVSVGSLDGRYTLYPLDDAYRIPETRLGRDGRPNEYQPSGVLKSFGVEGHGLLAHVPETDRMTAGMPDPVAQTVRVLTNQLDLQREEAVAAAVTASGAVASSGAPTVKWDAANANPVADIAKAGSDMIVKPNRLLVSGAVWAKLRTNAKLVSAVFRNDGSSGIVSPAEAAAALDLEEVVVADARKSASAPKAAGDPTLAYVWGKVALLYRSGDPAMGMVGSGPSLGWTPTLGSREVLTQWMPDRGVRGCTAVLVREAREHLISAKRAGHLFTAAVS